MKYLFFTLTLCACSIFSTEALSRRKRNGHGDYAPTNEELISEMPADFTVNVHDERNSNLASDYTVDLNVHLTPTDFAEARVNAEVIASDEPASGDDPIMLAGQFEGDIVNVTSIDISSLLMTSNNARNAIRNKHQLWQNGKVPYVISSHYNKRERGVIASAIEQYHGETCIKFVPRTNQRDYIHIVKGSGCSSSVGRVGRGQQVSLGRGCVYKGIVQHELMHALGFWHEQSRADRDDNVEIVWSNINPAMKFNFMKYTLTQIQHLNAPYDSCSVMHYSSTAFSMNGSPTIKKRKKSKCQLGQRKGFSKMDVKKINTLYSCSGYTQTTGSVKPKPSKPKPTEEVATVKPDLTCKDTNEYCATWAKNGECQVNPGWMLKNCPVACKECDNTCADHEPYCNKWKKNKECKRNPEYMNIYCARSCGVCSDSACKNDNDFCDEWADRGHCKSKKYKGYMKLRCQKSCGLCRKP